MDISTFELDFSKIENEIALLRAELQGLSNDGKHSIKDVAKITILMNMIEQKEEMLNLIKHHISYADIRD